ncbi:MAG TPA: VOC family protein [Blastocatellia bacterium]|nr:VOC family protein [Blastocatellia bacterium]
MQTTYCLSARQALGCLLLAAGCGAALAHALPINQARVTAAAQSESPATGEKKKMGKPVVHFEIGCRDSARTQAFYGRLFDWDITPAGPAAVINTGGEGINGHITALGHEPHHYVTVYVQVDDLQAYLDKATALGGKTLVPPVPIPTGKFAWLADPDGNIIGLLQPKQ